MRFSEKFCLAACRIWSEAFVEQMSAAREVAGVRRSIALEGVHDERDLHLRRLRQP